MFVMFVMSLAVVFANSPLSDLDLYGILCTSICFVAGPVSNHLTETIPELNSTRVLESILKHIKSLRIWLLFILNWRDIFTIFHFKNPLLQVAMLTDIVIIIWSKVK